MRFKGGAAPPCWPTLASPPSLSSSSLIPLLCALHTIFDYGSIHANPKPGRKKLKLKKKHPALLFYPVFAILSVILPVLKMENAR
jgi:hypothetical protein